MTLLVRAALAALALSGAGACGGGAASPAAPTAAHPPTTGPVVVTPSVALPCSAAVGLALPTGWPAAVPLPPGFVVTRTERRSGDRLIAYGRAPGDFHGVVTFFNAQLPKAGFRQLNGQLDPFDAESDFTGPGHDGRWATGLSPDCADRANLTVLVTPGSPS